MKKFIFLVVLISLFIPIQIVAIINSDSSYIVMETTTTNRILEGNNLNNQYLVASTAKIMTAITAIENYKLDEKKSR